MNFDLIPDIGALASLLVLLFFVRRRQPDARVDLWLAGLVLILAEIVAHFLYLIPGPWHRVSHIIALDCYAFAGSVFIWAALTPLYPRSFRLAYALANTPPILVLLTFYGVEVHSPTPYLAVVAFGLVTGVGCILYLRINPAFLLARIPVWMLMGVCVHLGNYRQAVYLGLSYVFFVVAMSFQLTLPERSIGKYAILAGFGTWSAIFLVHPWAVHHHRLDLLIEELWNLQAFAVTIGMLIVLLERQITRNEHLALHDQLTGLPNRRLLDDRISQATLQSDRVGNRVALFVFDLNGFKAINDSLGHDAGDLVLVEVARNLRQSLRNYNTLARLGGDEFAILSPDLAPDHLQAHTTAIAIADSIVRAVAQPLSCGPHTLSVTGSIGFAIYPDDAADPALLRRLADLRMYEGKHARSLSPANTSLATS